MPNQLLDTAVPAFASIADLKSELGKKVRFEPADLYPRDGNLEVAELEARIAELVGFNAGELVLCNTGMAAVTGALETCIQDGAVVACAEQSYAQTMSYTSQNLPRRGVKVVRFDSGDLASIDRVVQEHSPSIIFCETVANGPDVPVLDLPGLFNLKSVRDADPYIILDNTLPLSTGLPLGATLTGRRKVLAVESGTKSYAFNKEMCGLIYSKDPDLLRAIRQQRRAAGFFPNVAALARIDGLLPSSPGAFHERNVSIFRNTAALASACYEVSQRVGGFSVSYPLLPSHPNKGLAPQYNGYLGPIFFLHCAGSDDQFDLAERLWRHPVVRDSCELGQSFCFDRTRIMPDDTRPVVRISGGAHTDVPALIKAFEEALGRS